MTGRTLAAGDLSRREGSLQRADGEGDRLPLAEGVVLVLDRERVVVAGRVQGVDEPGPERVAVGVAATDGDVVPGTLVGALVRDRLQLSPTAARSLSRAGTL